MFIWVPFWNVKNLKQINIKKTLVNLYEDIVRTHFLYNIVYQQQHKNVFIWVPWYFWHLHDKTQVSFIFKIHILCFVTSTLFARILGENVIIIYTMKKTGENIYYFQKLMFQEGTTFDYDFYVVVGKQCRTEDVYAGHQHNIFI